MKKLIAMLIMTVLFILIGCSNKEVTEESRTFKGENESWSGEYKVNLQLNTGVNENTINIYEGEKTNVLILTYKKDVSNLSSIKRFKISYESSLTGGSREGDYTKDNPLNEKVFILQCETNGIEIEKKDEIVKLTIASDGKVETIDLKNAN
ncbi:MAG: hypothetical protein RR840_04590 [Clostridium sp.]